MPTAPSENREAFRDSIGTISEDGKRLHIHPKRAKGRFTTWRQRLSYGLLALLFAGPWLRIGGMPFLQLDVLHRRFILLGQVFWPQDFHLLVILMLLGVLAVALFTVALGRLFCGWICPQTIFMEHVFRRIEYWVDGDRNAQIRLQNMPWNAEKIRKRLIKNALFAAISFAISNTFLMYLIGTDAWKRLAQEGPDQHTGGFTAILIFTGVFFFVFAWFREQVCLIVCPYGRLQGVLLDRNSLVIAYDRVRGESRAPVHKGEDRTAAGKGDCVDCSLCVQVCPTGIDIRNGTQLECINCTACIDVCDEVMEKTHRPTGLIRYASEANIAEKKPFVYTPRLRAYTVLLAALVVLMGALLFLRLQVEATVLRAPGQTFQIHDTAYTNLYTYKLINKSGREGVLSMALPEGAPGTLQWIGPSAQRANAKGMAQGSFFLWLPKSDVHGSKNKVNLVVYLDGVEVDRISTQFYGPR
jgi:cytochrome c oxidase accessory protein FixG